MHRDFVFWTKNSTDSSLRMQAWERSQNIPAPPSFPKETGKERAKRNLVFFNPRKRHSGKLLQTSDSSRTIAKVGADIRSLFLSRQRTISVTALLIWKTVVDWD